MPYENEHSCRLEDPGKYDKFARKNCAEKHDGKCIDVIYGIKAGKSEIQALRYGKDIWSESAARNHCKSREGSFEPAEAESKTNDSKMEMRSYPIELRFDDSGGKPKILGHAALFNELSVDLGGFKEKIKKGTFKNSILNSDIKALKNHDSNLVLGRNKSGTLVLEEDYKGLKMTIDPPNTSYANDLMESMKRGDIDQCSFAFRTIIDEWDAEDKDNIIRTLKEVELLDVSIVTYPAYPQTSANIRSPQEVYTEYRNKLNQNLEAEKLAELKELKEKLTKEKAKRDRDLDLI